MVKCPFLAILRLERKETKIPMATISSRGSGELEVGKLVEDLFLVASYINFINTWKRPYMHLKNMKIFSSPTVDYLTGQGVPVMT